MWYSTSIFLKVPLKNGEYIPKFWLWNYESKEIKKMMVNHRILGVSFFFGQDTSLKDGKWENPGFKMKHRPHDYQFKAGDMLCWRGVLSTNWGTMIGLLLTKSLQTSWTVSMFETPTSTSPLLSMTRTTQIPSGKLTGRTEGCPGKVVWTSVGSSFLCAGAVFYDSGTSVG
jgi:hypothetical protein